MNRKEMKLYIKMKSLYLNYGRWKEKIISLNKNISKWKEKSNNMKFRDWTTLETKILIQ